MTVDCLTSARRRRIYWLLFLPILLVWLTGGVTRMLASQSVELSWSPSGSAGIVAYEVFYGTQSGVYPNAITFGNVLDVTIPGLADGQTYYFAVAAIDSLGLASALSEEIVYTTPTAAAIEVEAAGSTNALEAVSLNWTALPEGDIYGYAISYGTESGVYTNSVDFYGVTNAVISGLGGGETYYFAVAPIDSLGVEPIASDVAAYTVPVLQPPSLQAKPAVNTPGVELTWNGPANEGISSYYIFYGTQSGNYTSAINAGSATDYTVRNLPPGQDYYFAVVPLDAYGNEGPWSNEASSPASAPAPVQVQAQGTTAALGAVEVTWTASADNDVYGYAVDYWIPGSGVTNSVDFYGVTTGMITGLDAGTNYCFAIAPIGSMGVEAVASGVAAYTVPNAFPITLQAQALAHAPSVALTWTALPSDGVAGYMIYYGTQSGSYTYSIYAGAVNNWVVPDLTGSQTYYFAVAAVDEYGDQSPLSNEASVTTVAPVPVKLQSQTYNYGPGQPELMEINTPSTVSGAWEMDTSTDLQNWTYYTSGYGPGNGDGYDIDVYCWIDPTVPQIFFRVHQ